MSNITKSAINLVQPGSPGMVSIPLADLDKMRADHIEAIKLAKELESKQALVKIIYCDVKNEAVPFHYTGYDHRGKPRNEVRYNLEEVEHERKIEYKGFDEFRDLIKQEELVKINKEMNSIRKDNENLSSALQEAKNKNTDLRKEINELIVNCKDVTDKGDKLIIDLEEALSLQNDTKKLLDKEKEKNEDHVKMYQNLLNDYNILFNRKAGFFNFLFKRKY